MKLNPMSPKIAAAILLAATGATLSITPAHAADDNIPAHVVQTINKYDISSFKEPVFETPKVVSWAVAYTPSISDAELSPAQKALLSEDAQLAQKQKTIVVKEAAVKRAEQARIAAEKAAAEKAEAERIAAIKAAEEKAAAEIAAAAKAEADRIAAVEAAQQAAIAQAAAAARVVQPAGSGSAITTQSASISSASTPASSKIGAALVGSAYSQIGIQQDCTAMVEKALRSVGKSVGDLAPNDFYRYGTVVTVPQPGDLMITPGHVAIYVGNGMAISGGFNGHDTVLHPASYLAGSTFVRVS